MSMFRIVRQLFLALVVVLGLALVGPVGTASADSGTCDVSGGYVKPASSPVNQPWGSVSWVNNGSSVTYTVADGYKIGFCYKAGTFVEETVIDGPDSGTWQVSVQQGISHIGYKIISSPPDVQKDASFTKSISAATCATGEVLTYSGSNVTFSGPASGVTGPKSAADATVTATPISGHAWSDGTKTARTVSNVALAGPLDADSADCAAKDATANVTVSDPTCASSGVASVSGVSHASLTSGPLDQSVGTHTATFTADSGHRFADGQKTKNVDYTIASKLDADSDACASQDATADVSVSPPSCDSAGVASVTGLAHASLDGTLDQSVGAHTAHFLADSGHRFADGSKTKDVPYTIASKIDADDDACAVKDATAGVSVSPPSCDSAGVASVTGLAHASLDGTLDQSVGAHTAHFLADSGHRFADGSKTKDVPYTIASKIDADDDACAVKDATAGVSVSPPSCDSAGVASVTGLAHASLDGTLDQSVGAHTAHFLADSGHRFADGSKTKDVPYTIASKIDADDDQCAVHNAAADVIVTDPGCDSAGTAMVTGLSFATLDGTLDQSVGTHTAHFLADSGHRFADGSKTKDVPYTIQDKIDADDDQCADQDAAADVVVTDPGCEAPGMAAVSGLSFATLDGTLDQSVGTHTAHFLADSGHRFADGSKTKDVEYTITALNDEEYFDQCAPEQPLPEQRAVPGTEESCELGGVHTWNDVYTTPYVWDAEAREWKLGEETGPVAEDDAYTPYTEQELVDHECIEVEGEQGHGHHGHHNPHQPGTPEVKGEQAVVPTQVEAGLGTMPGGSSQETPGRNPLWLMMIGAGLGMIALGRRRKHSL